MILNTQNDTTKVILNEQMYNELFTLFKILQTANKSNISELKLLGEHRDLYKYFSKFVKLDERVRNIARNKIRGNMSLGKPTKVKKSRSIIHNRINKAGSTTVQGMYKVIIKLGKQNIEFFSPSWWVVSTK